MNFMKNLIFLRAAAAARTPESAIAGPATSC